MYLLLCTIAIKLGHADIIDLLQFQSNLSIPVFKNVSKIINNINNKHHQEIRNVYQCHKVACYTYYRPTYLPAAKKKKNSKQGQYKKKPFSRKKFKEISGK